MTYRNILQEGMKHVPGFIGLMRMGLVANNHDHKAPIKMFTRSLQLLYRCAKYIPPMRSILNIIEGMLPNESGMLPNEEGMLPIEKGLLPNEEGVLPDEGLFLKEEGILPNEVEMLPNEKSMLPNEEGLLPNEEGMLAIAEGMLRNKEGMPSNEEILLTYEEGMLPIEESMLPNEEGMLPNEECLLPNEESMLLNGEGMLSNEVGLLPNEESMLPNEEGMLPKEVGLLLNEEGMPPSEKGMLPNEVGLLLKEEGTLPNEESMLPNEVGVLPNEKGMLAIAEGMLRNEEGLPANKEILLTCEEGMLPNEESMLPNEECLPTNKEEGMLPNEEGLLPEEDLVMTYRGSSTEGGNPSPACSSDSKKLLPIKRIDAIKREGACIKKKLKETLRLVCLFGKTMPYVGGFVAVLEGVLPKDSTEVDRFLQDLSEEIRAIREDIKELKNEIKLDILRAQYSSTATKIQTGIEAFSEWLESTNVERAECEERLKETCANRAMYDAVRNLLDGLIAEDSGILHTSILRVIYDNTKGHRGRFKEMCNHLLNLFFGGLAVIGTNEMLVHSENSAKSVLAKFKGDIKKLKTRVEHFQALQEKYEESFKDNMLSDLRGVLNSDQDRHRDREHQNKDAVADLNKILQEQYNWLECYCIICNRSDSIDYDFWGDNIIESFDKKKTKRGVIFYRERLESPACENLKTPAQRKDERIGEIIKKVDKGCKFSTAATINNALVAEFQKNGFRLWGCATVKARRLASVPLINIPTLIESRKVLKEIRAFKEETSNPVIFENEDNVHWCLVTTDK